MPEAAKNYSITELEMCGLAMNIATFSHLLKKVNFDAVVDHLAITHIMRSEAEPATTRIKRLLELLSPYSFNLYYIKGKNMVLSNHVGVLILFIFIYIDQRSSFSLNRTKFCLLITSFRLVPTKASSGVMENVSPERCITNILENVYIYNFDQ